MTKHHKKRGDNYSRDEDWLLDAAPDEPNYGWLSQVPTPWQKRWLDDPEKGHRLRDNEGWDQDRINERRRARKSFNRGGHARRRLRLREED